MILEEKIRKSASMGRGRAGAPAAVMVSTMSLVAIRSVGVAIRYFALFILASLVSPELFAQYGVALLCAELGRLVSDSGLDSTFLRKAQPVGQGERAEFLRRGLLIKLVQGAVALLVIETGLVLSFGWDPLLMAIGGQFIAQSLLQLALNGLQVDDRAHRIAPVLLAAYGLGAAVSVVGVFGLAAGRWGLPAIAAAEAAIAIGLLGRLVWPLPSIADAYRSYFPLVLPMVGISILAFINTKSDSILAAHFISSAESGRYFYLVRWAELGPMVVAGFGLPLVGKMGRLLGDRLILRLAMVALLLSPLPPLALTTGLMIRPEYGLSLTVEVLIALVSIVRLWLVLATVTLLAQWRDVQLIAMVAITSVVNVGLGLVLGARYGAAGVASAALVGEAASLVIQLALIAHAPKARA